MNHPAPTAPFRSLRSSPRVPKHDGYAIWPAAVMACALTGDPAFAQSPAAVAASSASSWQACAPLADAARLACYDSWARGQQALSPATAKPTPPGHSLTTRSTLGRADAAQSGTAPVAPATSATASAGAPAPAGNAEPATEGTLPGPTTVLAVGKEQGCRNRKYSEVSRFWELEQGSSCPTFGLRAFRPNILAVAHGTTINRQPQSANPVNSATRSTGYSRNEARVLLSIRTKLASGLLASQEGGARDSLWMAYTQQSYWQVFNGAISRPFRNTDYQPELIYVYPTTVKLPGGWKWRYTGAGLVHQSNGQSDPLSRSWNRAYLMAGFEKDDRFNLQVRVWQRFHESAAKDNNPDIVKRIGRGDITLGWNVGDRDTLRFTYTGSFNKYGSERLEWSHALGTGNGNTASGLRFYTGLFHGYGDSLIDYNFKRTVLSVGLSLVDF